MEVIPASGANADSVAEYTIISIGMLLRGAFEATASIAAGHWPRERLSTGREMAGKTLGILGFGDIGRRVARLARAFGMRSSRMTRCCRSTIPTGRNRDREVTLDELAARSDAITLHVPLEASNRGRISAELLAAMTPGRCW